MIYITVLIVAVMFTYWFFKMRWERKNYPPGPLLLPYFGNFFQVALASPNPERAFDKLAKQYGPIMSLNIGAIDSIVVTDLKMIEDILKREDMSDRPITFTVMDRNFNGNNGIIFTVGETRKIIRQYSLKILKEFGFSKANSMEYTIGEEITEFISHIKKEMNGNNGIVRVDNLFVMSMLNIIWSFVSGARFSHDNPKLKRLIEISTELVKSSIYPNISESFPILAKLFPKLSGKNRQKKQIKVMQDFLRMAIKDHNEGADQNFRSQNFLGIFIDKIEEEKCKPGTVFTEEQLIIILLDLFQGGSETSGHILAFAILYLILNPNVQNTLQEEIDRILPAGVTPTLKHKHSMIYTQATIYETLRCGAVLPFVMRSPTADFYYRGYLFKKGISVLSNLHTIFNDKNLWKDPENFRPERFIKQDGTLDSYFVEKIVAFGLGKRMCIGENLATSTIFLFLVSLLQKMTFKCIAGEPKPSTEPVLGFTMSPQPFDVFIEMRQ